MMFCGRAKNVIFPSWVLDNKILRIQVSNFMAQI
jgi:hypothetical protein